MHQNEEGNMHSLHVKVNPEIFAANCCSSFDSSRSLSIGEMEDEPYMPSPRSYLRRLKSCRRVIRENISLLGKEEEEGAQQKKSRPTKLRCHSTKARCRLYQVDASLLYFTSVIIVAFLYSSFAIIGATGKPQGLNRELEKQIVDKILGEGYDKRIRPSGINNTKTGAEGDGSATVRVNTLIRSISKIDDVTMEYSVQLSLRQEWTDERLAYNRIPAYKTYNIPSITLTEQERLWKPDLFFRNEKEGHFHKIIMPNVLLRIFGDGSVLYSIRISLVLACPMDLKYYPLDKQNCTIQMASYGYLEDDLKFIWKEKDPVQINKPLTLPRFRLERFETAFCTSRTSTGAYSCLRVDLIFKREFSYYLIQIYIPCCMLVIVSWVSFWLDPNAIPARVSLGVTTLLTMATQISGINASLPPVSYIKAIDVWTGVCLTFVFGALLEFALVNYASRSDAHAKMQLMRQEEELKARSLEFQQRRMAAALAKRHQAAANTNKQHLLLDANGQPNFYGQTGYGQFPNAQGKANGLSHAAGKGGGAGQLQPVGPNPAKNGAQQYTLTATGDPESQQYQSEKQFLNHSQFQLKSGGKQCELHHSLLRQSSNLNSDGRKKKNVNFCRAWLNKFPSRSKRIDVISRIFFPKMFALFNLVYWTTYLFREDEIAQA